MRSTTYMDEKCSRVDVTQKRLAVLLFLQLALTPGVMAAGAQQSSTKKVVPVPHLSMAPVIDGVLESAWNDAAVITEFYEVEPGRNSAPPVKTVAYVGYDNQNFYFAFHCLDPKPGAIRATVSDRDKAFDDDAVAALLDTFNDSRRAYEFFVNPYGIQGDLTRTEGQGEDASFDAIWHSAARITEDGWIAEAAVPFKSIRFQNAQTQSWGFALFRNYPRAVRHQIVSLKLNYDNPCIICQFDTFAGIQNVKTGRNIELVPTVTGLYTDRPLDAGDHIRRDVQAGLGVKYAVTPSVTLDFATNPDFSQVEADVDQLDVNTRFALFFPEKRPFFLEGQDYFTTSGPLNLFHSRAIVDPLVAGKLTGKVGPHQFGVISASDQSPAIVVADPEGSSVFSLPGSSIANVARYRHDLLTSSSVGGFVSDLRLEGGHSTLAAADLLLRPYRNLDVSALVARSSADALGSPELGEMWGRSRKDGNAYFVSARFGSRAYEVHTSYTDITRDFRADLGFLQRTDLRRIQFGGIYQWYPEAHPFIVRIGPTARYSRASNHGDASVEGRVTTGVFGELRKQVFFFAGYNSSLERVQGVLFDNLSTVEVELFARPAQMFTGGVFYTRGDQLDFANLRRGKGYQLGANTSLKPTDRLSFDLSTSRQVLDRSDLNAEVFHAQTARLKTVYQFTTRLFVRSIFQYRWVDRDPAQHLLLVRARDRRLESFLLFSYKLNPQTVFFFGYNDALTRINDASADLERTSRTFFMKLGYTFRP